MQAGMIISDDLCMRMHAGMTRVCLEEKTHAGMSINTLSLSLFDCYRGEDQLMPC